MWKPKFLRKLTDSVYTDDYYEDFDDVFPADNNDTDIKSNTDMAEHISLKDDANVDSNQDSRDTCVINNEPIQELPVDVYQTPEEIVVRTMLPGVQPHNVDISLTRDMITITASREETKEVTEEDYFYRELSWGEFTRTIMLPAEVEVDEADAQEKHGVLTIRLPKINKERQAKVKVKSL